MVRTSVELQVESIAGPTPELADELLAGYAFLPYRQWRGFGPGVPKTLLRWELLTRHEDPAPWWWLVTDDSGPLGVACVVPNRWESEQLGIRVADLRHLIARGEVGARRRAAGALLDVMRRQLEGSVDCLVHRVDNADYDTAAALTGHGFCLVDSAVSFMCGRTILPYLRRTFRRPHRVRPYREDDWPAVNAIVRQRGFPGRLHNDRRLQPERVEALYREWVRLHCQRVFANEVVVVERRGVARGFLSYELQRWMLEAAGIRLLGRGLLAVDSDHPGLALELVCGAILRDPQGADWLQFDTQVNNLALCTLLGRGLRMGVGHVRHVYHGWLNEEDAGAHAPDG